MPASTFNNVQIDAAATLAGTNGSTMNVVGNWVNNGGTPTSFTSNGNTVNFNGSAAQSIGGSTATVFNNLTIANAAGVSLTQNQTVDGLLTLTNDLSTGANTLTMPAAATSGPSTNAADVIGNVRRTSFATAACPVAPCANTLSFGNPDNQITITAGTAPASILVTLEKLAPATYAAAVQRNYTIAPTGGSGITATVRLHYLDSELNGNTPESSLNLRRYDGSAWKAVVPTNAVDTINNWVESDAVTTFSQWTFSSLAPTAASGTISGRITSDGTPVEGVVVRLSGNQSRKTITDAKGYYQFDSVETSSFYTVQPSRANYNFDPSNRSFSQTGNHTEAAFAGAFTGDNANPLETAEYFVRQQYVDLLGREPDEGGFNYWSNEILRCGNDANCVNARRSDIAAAFFIEQEFQQTGSYIYNLYKGSLGRRPGYSEYAADRRQVIGGTDLETEKAAFAAGFVLRADFAQKYQAHTTAESFVDALLATIWQSSNLDQGTQRGVLLALYQTGSDMNQSRALVLRQVGENPSLKGVEYNPAFVLTEYFGYLRRNPEPEGYDFWLNVLNKREPGNFRGMVCSFITSTEYQKRFSAVVTHSNAECGR